MDRYRYFIFNQRGMFVLGILQIVCATVCVVSGFVDSTFRKDSILSRTRAPVWAGTFMGLPGVLALFSSQKRNPVLVNSMIGSGVISWFTTTIVILYAALTLNYGEDDDEVFQHKPSYIIHAEYILSKLVQGANMAILISSVFGLMIATVIAYLGCRSLPNCACYDSTTGMQSLLTEERHPQAIELVCTWQGVSEQRILNDPVQLKDWDLDSEEAEFSTKPPPYIRFA
ncbi:uncharacterized protein zgc:113425 [Callorhinchus milii]|uniref:uncharacterized protein zgc:113425 n=1 Tax=Callorhinchus milii TaxID=7868 RepID=UPI0004571591|nr:uncharacterized protein zgc:113425 [Callorhinchus milii]XP_007895869.1 uncharacterized protein zgc:113425 [Callorhinchus milii]XP_007895871.1 uncharacterized protein zgc:113425 [Callorhinchus milii]|eukprot:gi/632959863/ref/XP_007895868.1/ PREDICTED: uncharacterized protein LOC103181298 [Callorhinchus milii]